MKTALITGITGQDGHHLSKLLLEKSYKVVGLVSGQRTHRIKEFENLFPTVELMAGDLTNFASLCNAIDKVSPNEIYNLGAISFVGMSFQHPEATANVTGLGALRLLEAIRHSGSEKAIRMYQASSSEMFGNVVENPQTESTSFHPRSPYGVAKVFAHQMCLNYRDAYGMHVSSGILFNHEGEYRGKEFVTRKITSNIAKIKTGKISSFELGDLQAKRDWGYAGDYVEAMWLMIQQDAPDDYVIATGETHSVEEFLTLALSVAELDGPIDEYVTFNPNLVRPAEVEVLVGDSSKARKYLGWKPKVEFENLVRLMVENDLKLESKK